MGGRASLIMVIGFAVIFGFINMNIAKITSSAVENMVSYNEIAVSRNVANAGANAGLAMLTYKPYPHNARILSAKTFTSGPYAGCSYIARIDSYYNVATNPKSYLIMKSISACTTSFFTNKAKTNRLVLNDTVEVRLDYDKTYSFSSFGWMSLNEGNVFFTTGDTLWGKVHSNSNIHIDAKPVFWGKVTTSGTFDPKKNSGVFKSGYESGVAEKPFPNDLSGLSTNATNKLSGIDAGHTNTQTALLYVELKPGTSADNDGYAILRTGSFTGTKVDSIPLNGSTDNVIYSTQDIHVKGVLDGRLSVASNTNLVLDGNITYERKPDPYHTDPGLTADPPALTLAGNLSSDMLGLVAGNDVTIPSSYSGDIEIDGSIFAKSGSFQAENWNYNHSGDWRINIIGSVCQKDRGAVGQTNGNGYKKSYRFDPRYDDAFSAQANMHPPSFPSYSQPSNVSIKNWWESVRIPIDITQYY